MNVGDGSSFAARRPGWVLVVSLLAALPLWLLGAGIRFDASMPVLLESDPRQRTTYDRAKTLLRERELVVVLMETEDGVFDDEAIAALRTLSERLRALPGAGRIASLTHLRYPVVKGMFNLSFESFVPKEPTGPARWRAIGAHAIRHPLARHTLVSPDGRYATAMVVLAGDFDTPAAQAALATRLAAAVEGLEAKGRRFHRLAMPLVEQEVRRSVEADLRIYLPLAALLTVAILWLTTRSWRALLLILGCEALCLSLLPGVVALVAWATAPLLAAVGAEALHGGMTPYTAMLLPLVAAIQLTLLIHLVSAWQRAVHEGPTTTDDPGAGTGADAADPANPADAAAGWADGWTRALALVGPATRLAALTTAVGLAALLAGEINILREVGILGAAMVLVALAITLLPAVALGRLWLRDADAGKAPGPDCERGGGVGGLSGFGGFGDAPGGYRDADPEGQGGVQGLHRADLPARARRRAIGIVLAALVVLMGAIPGILALRPHLRVIEFLPASSPTRMAAERFDQRFGGINLLQLDVATGAAGGADRPDVIRFLEELRLRAEAREEVSMALSYAMLYSVLNQAWAGGAPEAFHLPEEDAQLALYRTLIRLKGFPLLDDLRDPDGRTARFFLRTADMPAARYLALVQDLLRWAEAHAPAGTSLRLHRGVHSLLEADSQIVRGQLGSLLVSVAAVLALLWIAWRSPAMAVVAVGGNLLPLALMLGVAGWMGISLNVMTVMVGAIAFGISVDDTVHVLGLIQRLRPSLGVAEAIRVAVARKRKPVVATTTILAAILSLLLLSSFPPVRAFGFLALIQLLAALGAVLHVTPALLRLLLRDHAEPRRPRVPPADP